MTSYFSQSLRNLQQLLTLLEKTIPGLMIRFNCG